MSESKIIVVPKIIVQRRLAQGEDLWEARTDRNFRVLGKMIKKLREAGVAVIGLGGVGGALAELLVRTGFVKIAITDSTSFEITNLNRQIGATYRSCINREPKALVMKKRLLSIDPFAQVEALTTNPWEYDVRKNFLRECKKLNVKIVANCVDTVSAQCSVARLANELGVPMIIGGVVGEGVEGIVTTFKPGVKYWELLKEIKDEKTVKKTWFKKYKKFLPEEVKAKYNNKGIDDEPYPVLTPVPWILVSVMTIEIIKIVTEIQPPVFFPYVILYKGWSSECSISKCRISKIIPWRP